MHGQRNIKKKTEVTVGDLMIQPRVSEIFALLGCYAMLDGSC